MRIFSYIYLSFRWLLGLLPLNSISRQGVPHLKNLNSSQDCVADTLFAKQVPERKMLVEPLTFSSCLCREQHYHMPLYTYWCKRLKEHPRYHRKQWEFIFICHSLYERGYLSNGKTAIGFGVGREPLASLFATYGMDVLATDLAADEAARLGWVDTNQHSDELASLNERGICDMGIFEKKVTYRNVNMKEIPEDIGTYDVCWSSCAFEHLGSIRAGLDFVIKSSRLLRPGGIGVHTTEYNISSNEQTLDNNEAFVIFRRRDLELLCSELKEEGCLVEPIDFTAGSDGVEELVDMPPYKEEPHLRLQLAGKFTSTSIGLIVRREGISF